MLSLPGCVPLEIVTAATNAGAAYFSYQAANRPLITLECAWAETIAPNDASLSVMDRESLERIAIHNEMVDKCEGR